MNNWVRTIKYVKPSVREMDNNNAFTQLNRGRKFKSKNSRAKSGKKYSKEQKFECDNSSTCSQSSITSSFCSDVLETSSVSSVSSVSPSSLSSSTSLSSSSSSLPSPALNNKSTTNSPHFIQTNTVQSTLTKSTKSSKSTKCCEGITGPTGPTGPGSQDLLLLRIVLSGPTGPTGINVPEGANKLIINAVGGGGGGSAFQFTPRPVNQPGRAAGGAAGGVNGLIVPLASVQGGMLTVTVGAGGAAVNSEQGVGNNGTSTIISGFGDDLSNFNLELTGGKGASDGDGGNSGQVILNGDIIVNAAIGGPLNTAGSKCNINGMYTSGGAGGGGIRAITGGIGGKGGNCLFQGGAGHTGNAGGGGSNFADGGSNGEAGEFGSGGSSQAAGGDGYVELEFIT